MICRLCFLINAFVVFLRFMFVLSLVALSIRSVRCLNGSFHLTLYVRTSAQIWYSLENTRHHICARMHAYIQTDIHT